MTETLIDEATVAALNGKAEPALKRDYAALGEQLARRNIEIDDILAKVSAFHVAISMRWAAVTC